MKTMNSIQGWVRVCMAVGLAVLCGTMAKAQDFDTSGLYEVTVIPGGQSESTGGFTTSSAGQCNNCVDLVPLDFNFTYYGNTFDEIILASNGFMTFDLTQTGTPGPGGWEIPGTGYPPDTIALVGTNMAPSIFNIGSVRYKIEGEAPNRVFIAYHDGRTYNNNVTPDNVNAQLKLYESTNVVELHYFSNGGNFAFSQDKSGGIQDGTQTQGHQAWRETGTSGPPSNVLYRYDPNPQVVSFERQSSQNPIKSGDAVTFRLTFDRGVTTPTPAAFALNEDGGVNGSTIDSITAVSGSGPPLGGTIGAQLADTGQSIVAQGTGRLQPAGFTFDSEVFEVDNDPPLVTVGAPSPSVGTQADVFDFPVTITGAVSSSLSDIEVNVIVTSGTLGLVTIEVLDGDSFTPTIRASDVSGDGTFTVAAISGIAVDGPGNLSLPSDPSPAATVANSAPGIGVGSPTPGAGNTATTFNFPVTIINAASSALNISDLIVDANGVTLGPVQVLDPSSFNPTIQVSGVTGEGSFTIAVPAGIAQNALDVPNQASAPSPPAIVDNTPPGIAIGQPSVTETNTGPVTYLVSYDGASQITLDSADVALQASGTVDASVDVSGSGLASRTVTLFNITGDGTLAFSLPPGTGNDAAGNVTPAIGSPAVVTVNNTAPAAPVILTDGGNGPGQDYTTSATSVVLSGTVGPGVAQVLLNGSPIASYSPNSSVWSVPVDLLTAGPVANLSVVARDALGNQSAPASITIVYEASEDPGEGGFPEAPPGSPAAGIAGLAALTAALAALGARRRNDARR